MLGRIFTVGGYTLLSRLTGLARDIMLAAFLGAGPVADAFYVAWRLPNNFRAIFAEGAFNTAFIPAYAHVQGKGGETSGRLFASQIFTLLFLSQVVLLVAAWLFMPQVIGILAPGFRYSITTPYYTFPYLIKYTPQGSIVWAKSFDGLGIYPQNYAAAYKCFELKDGSLLLVGGVVLGPSIQTSSVFPRSLDSRTSASACPMKEAWTHGSAWWSPPSSTRGPGP